MLCFDLCGCKKNTLAALALVDEQSASEGQIMAQRTVVEIRCQLEEFSDFLPSGFLAMVARFASDIDFFKPFEEHLKVPIKQVYYSMVQKIQTIMASILGSDFVLKGYSTKTAHRLAKDVCQVDWHCSDFFIRLSDLAEQRSPAVDILSEWFWSKPLLLKGKKSITISTPVYPTSRLMLLICFPITTADRQSRPLSEQKRMPSISISCEQEISSEPMHSFTWPP